MNGRPSHLSADERRNATVEAVMALAARANPATITTAEIARRMGVTQGALFRHFPTKDVILEATMRWVSEQLLARVEAAAESAASPAAALEAMFMAHVDFIARHPGVPRMVFGQLQRTGKTAAKTVVQALLRRYRVRLCALLEAGKAGGEFDPALDVDAAAVLFIGTIQGLAMQSLLAGRAAQMREHAPGVFSVYRRGIGVAS